MVCLKLDILSVMEIYMKGSTISLKFKLCGTHHFEYLFFYSSKQTNVQVALKNESSQTSNLEQELID